MQWVGILGTVLGSVRMGCQHAHCFRPFSILALDLPFLQRTVVILYKGLFFGHAVAFVLDCGKLQDTGVRARLYLGRIRFESGIMNL